MKPETGSQSAVWDDIGRKKLSLADADIRRMHEREARWYRWFVSMLPVRGGDRVLDCGCGDGFLSVELARRGGVVTGFDVSESALDVAVRRAELYGVSRDTRFVASAFESIEDVAGSGRYDLICGMAILHHVDTGAAGEVIGRLLAPGRRAIFLENSVDNRMLMWVRSHLVHKRRLGLRPIQEDVEEFPFSADRLDAMRPYFRTVAVTHPEFNFWRQGYRVAQVVLPQALEPRVIPPLVDALRLVDRATYLLLPPIRRFSWWQVVELHA